jgi:hypothetical protein
VIQYDVHEDPRWRFTSECYKQNYYAISKARIEKDKINKLLLFNGSYMQIKGWEKENAYDLVENIRNSTLSIDTTAANMMQEGSKIGSVGFNIIFARKNYSRLC